MTGLLTSLIPIEFFDPNDIKEILSECRTILQPSTFDVIHCEDLNSPFHSCFEIIPSNEIDRIFVLLAETTIVIAINWKIEGDKYFLVNQILKIRNRTVKRIIQSKESVCEALNKFLNTICIRKKVQINYSFCFTSILTPSLKGLEFAKILALPSIIGADDMITTPLKDDIYNNSTKISKKQLDEIDNIDIKNGWNTYVTWASLVSVTNTSYEALLENHLFIILLEAILQTNWNKCYSYNKIIENCILDFNKKKLPPRSIRKIRIEAYRTLMISKNVVSATFSSRVSAIFNAMTDTSAILKQIKELEDKLGFLQLYLENKINYDNEKLQKSTELLLFIIAIPQVAQMFIQFPVLQNANIGYFIISIITFLGIFIISKK